MRSGILAAGNFIIDYVKIIDTYPDQDTLAIISAETASSGGGPYNVLKDLSAMGVAYPLEAAGLVGADANGKWILNDCAEAHIDTRQLRQCEDARAPTSYTDAMTVASTGRRTFFHQLGANALFSDEDLDFTRTNARHFHLAYLMLLDAMDSFVGGRTRASLTLERARSAGLETSVDIVTSRNPQFREITESALPYTCYLVLNEIEAGRATGLELRPGGRIDLAVAEFAAKQLLAKGVEKQVVIHFVEGAVLADGGGQVLLQGSLNLPQDFVAGATGAGDAFAAGYLHGVHESWPTKLRLELAVCCAAACLSHPTPSKGLAPVEDCLKLMPKYGVRDIG